MANLLYADIPNDNLETEYKQRAKKIIDDAVALFNAIDSNAYFPGRNLWNVLTALRGPDSEDQELKRKTTSNLRGAIGMDQFTTNTGAIVTKDNVLELEEQDDLMRTERTSHFGYHYRMATKALKYFGYIR